MAQRDRIAKAIDLAHDTKSASYSPQLQDLMSDYIKLSSKIETQLTWTTDKQIKHRELNELMTLGNTSLVTETLPTEPRQRRMSYKKQAFQGLPKVLEKKDSAEIIPELRNMICTRRRTRSLSAKAAETF